MHMQGGLKACLKGYLEGWGEILFWSKWAGGQQLHKKITEGESNVTYKNHWERGSEFLVAKIFIHRKQIKDICALKAVCQSLPLMLQASLWERKHMFPARTSVQEPTHCWRWTLSTQTPAGLVWEMGLGQHSHCRTAIPALSELSR